MTSCNTLAAVLISKRDQVLFLLTPWSRNEIPLFTYVDVWLGVNNPTLPAFVVRNKLKGAQEHYELTVPPPLCERKAVVR